MKFLIRDATPDDVGDLLALASQATLLNLSPIRSDIEYLVAMNHRAFSLTPVLDSE